MADAVLTEKERIEQKKSKLLKQEALLKERERKNRVRHFIEVGGLAAKAQIDHLPSDVLFGAFLSIKETYIKDSAFLDAWAKTGGDVFKSEVKTKIPVILKMETKPTPEIRNKIRDHQLRWNAIRKEWSGMVADLEQLKLDLGELKFSIEVLNS